MNDKNVEAVRRQLLERSKVGIKKYGVTTERQDLTMIQWLQHAQDEMMDAAVYLERIKSEVQRDVQEIRQKTFQEAIALVRGAKYHDAPDSKWKDGQDGDGVWAFKRALHCAVFALRHAEAKVPSPEPSSPVPALEQAPERGEPWCCPTCNGKGFVAIEVNSIGSCPDCEVCAYYGCLIRTGKGVMFCATHAKLQARTEAQQRGEQRGYTDEEMKKLEVKGAPMAWKLLLEKDTEILSQAQQAQAHQCPDCAALREQVQALERQKLELFSQRDQAREQNETSHKYRRELSGECTALKAQVQALEKENKRLQEFHVTDMRVTNESADFHIKECDKLRRKLAQLQTAMENTLKHFNYEPTPKAS